MLRIKEYVDIKEYSTLHVGGQFRYFCVISSISELIEACDMAKKDKRKIFILGGGSNIVFSDGIIDVFALKIEIKGFEIINETDEFTDIKVGAGEIWDETVAKTIEMNLTGLEALSAIPGTVGATPVQNVGAYGNEVKDTIVEVEVFDLKENIIKTILNSDCKFGYRDSIFKNEAKDKYIITAVIYRLNKTTTFSPALNYPGVKNYFEDKGIKNPSLKQIREAIISIRNEKLPNPKELPNAGSFFKNPIVLDKITDKIREEFPNAKFFPSGDGFTKIPAGWLIENAGLKGKSFGNVSIYDKNALVLVNTENATFEDIVNARNIIIEKVKEKFGIILEQEPEII